MISLDAYFMGRDRGENDPTDEQRANAKVLLARVNALLADIPFPFLAEVASGYRPPAINASVGGSKMSAHMSCEAVDVRDWRRQLALWLRADMSKGTLALLVKHDLYMEHPDYTRTWCHLQTRPTRSGNRVFIP